MANRFNDFINNKGEDPVEFARLSGGLRIGTRLMLVRPLMGYEPGSVFTYATAESCQEGKIYRYRGIGEAFLYDPQDDPIVLKGGKEILDESFILVDAPSSKPLIQSKEEPSPSIEISEDVSVVREVRGERGERGEDGLPGVRGARGPKGDKGDPGEKGPQGDKGDKGDPGEKGERGLQGPPGIRGERGYRGERGEQGERGEKGEKGDQGPQGAQGERGVQGTQGEKGEKGERGDPGAQGSKGEKGDKGDRGEKGEKGDHGERGERGEKGEKGDRGEVGPQGIQGLAGEHGAVGPAGPKGDTGEKGEQGYPGEKGEKGDPGEKGDTGILSVQYPLKLDKDKQHLSIDLSKIKPTASAPILYDGGGGLGEAFKFISVSGQAGLTAVQYDKETLTFVAGTNIALATDADSNSITISSVGGQGSTGATGATGAGGALGYWGSFWDTTSQTAASITAAYAVRFNSNDPQNFGVSLSGSSQLVFSQTGVYNLQFSAQVFNSDNNQVHDVTFWLKKNGSDLEDTAGVASVDGKHSGITGAALPAWNWMLPLQANDVIQLYWHTNSTQVFLGTLANGNMPVHSRSPAVIFTAQQVMYTQIGPTGPKGETGAAGGVPANYVAGVNGITGDVGITVDGNIFLSLTGVNNKTILLSSKPPATVKGTAGALAWADTTVPFEGDGFDLGADTALKFNYLTDLALETPGSFRLGTIQGTGSYIEFGDGTTQGTAAKCCPPPLATTGASGVASFNNDYFSVTATGHVSIKTGIKAGNLIVLGTSTVFGAGATGALPALDGSNLLEVNAKYLQGKTPNQLTDGGTF